MSFWIDINSIPLCFFPGVGSHQWSGRSAAAQVLQTWAASSLTWVDGRGEPASGLSHIIPFLSSPPLHVPPVLHLFLSDIAHLPLSQSLHPTPPHLLTSDSPEPKSSQVRPVMKPAHEHRPSAETCAADFTHIRRRTRITHIFLCVCVCPLLQSLFSIFQFVLTSDCI